MDNLIGKELYCYKSHGFVPEFVKFYNTYFGELPTIAIPKPGTSYTVRGVNTYKEDPGGIYITLVEIRNPRIRVHYLLADEWEEPPFPIEWFRDLAEISLSQLEEATELV